jgi:hypothetical protein
MSAEAIIVPAWCGRKAPPVAPAAPSGRSVTAGSADTHLSRSVVGDPATRTQCPFYVLSHASGAGVGSGRALELPGSVYPPCTHEVGCGLPTPSDPALRLPRIRSHGRR